MGILKEQLEPFSKG